MTNITPISTARVLGDVLQTAIQNKITGLQVLIVLPGGKLILENTTALQILIELERSNDILNVNTTDFANLPAEKVEKLKEEIYSIKLVAFTDDAGGNLAYSVIDWITSIFQTQQALFKFQEARIRVTPYSDILDVTTALDVEKITILKFSIKVIKTTVFNTVADYYEVFPKPTGTVER